jgi:membrane protein implicated in regulation of membrane protease activity
MACTISNNKQEVRMAEWMVWFGLAGALVIFEMFTGTFYLLMIGAGLAAGGIAALVGGNSALQFIIAAVVGIAATYGLRRSKWGRSSKRDASHDPNVNLDIGQTLVIDTWSGGEGDVRIARAMYRGALWDVELEQGASARSGIFIIRAIRGNRLIVANNSSQ